MYTNIAKQHGMNFDRPSHFHRFESDNMSELRDFMSMAKSNNVRLVVFVTKEKLDPIHNSLKLCESKYGVITQHIWADNVRKCVENPNRKMTLINIIMKTNLKLGGINYDLRTSQTFSRANPKINYDIVYVL